MAVTSINELQTSQAPTTGRSIGVVRATTVAPHLDLTVLRHAAQNITVLPNPSASPGCSPLLRAFLVQTGLPFAVKRECAGQGDTAGHSSGNGLDIVAVPGTANPAAALGELSRAVQAAQTMFIRIVHRDDNYLQDNILYGNEAIPAGLYASSRSFLHIDSTTARIASFLSDPYFRSARKTLTDAFTAVDAQFLNRNVHYDPDANNRGRTARANSAATPVVNFW